MAWDVMSIKEETKKEIVSIQKSKGYKSQDAALQAIIKVYRESNL